MFMRELMQRLISIVPNRLGEPTATPSTAIRCATVCAPRWVSVGKKFRRCSREFVVVVMIDVDDDDQYFVELEHEEMESAELWERVIADLTEIEKCPTGSDKSPTRAIIETCLKTHCALGRK
jgi:hypothetical protein